MKTHLLSILTLCFTALSLPAQTVDLRMECSATTVRMGDSFTLDIWVDNPGLHDIAGYQIGFGWSTDKLIMTQEPETLPQSVLTDLFAFNAPPFGNGFSSCPDFGDGIERDGVFALSLNLSTGTPFSTGHLFRCHFKAKQAIDSVPQAFTYDEFANCIGQPTIVTDWSGVALPMFWIEKEVEVIPNLQSSSTFAIGNMVSFELHDSPLVVYQAGLSLEPGYENFGKIGEVFLDRLHSTFHRFSAGTLSATGEVQFNLQLPPFSSIVGRTLYAHTLSGTSSSRRLSNLFEATLLP